MRGGRKRGGRGEEEGEAQREEGGRTRKKGDEREEGIKEEGGEGTSNGTQFVTSYSYSSRRVR